MLHPDFPTKELHLAEYEKQWERDYDWIRQGFEYNYMNRATKYPTVLHGTFSYSEYYHKSGDLHTYKIDQLKVIKEKIASRIEKGGECLVSNRDQVITWIPDRDMFVKEDQPCMQRLQFFVYEYPTKGAILGGNTIGYESEKKGKAEFHVTWRSRDGFAAWNSNMIGLIKMLNKEVFEPNNLELIRVVDFCNSLHIYERDCEQAKTVKPAVIPPNLMR